VDRRAASLARRLREGEDLLAAVDEAGDVIVEGHSVGRLSGFRFSADETPTGADGRAVLAAAHRALAREIPARAARLAADGDDAFALKLEAIGPNWGDLTWRGAPLARLTAGVSALKPGVRLLRTDLLSGAQGERVRRRLALWRDQYLSRLAGSLIRAQRAVEDRGRFGGAARGLVFQLAEALGYVPRGDVAPQVGELTKAERAALAALGIRLGAIGVYMAPMLKPAQTRLSAHLWAVRHGLDTPPFLPPPASVSISVEAAVPPEYYAALGFAVLGRRALRIDMAERLAGGLRKRGQRGPFALDTALLALAGCGRKDFPDLAAAVGYGVAGIGEDGTVRFGKTQGGKAAVGQGPRRPPKQPAADPDSPFAKLGRLTADRATAR
jgi:ATP-dependent RNA helicase SUPV3L1/SUV3